MRLIALLAVLALTACDYQPMQRGKWLRDLEQKRRMEEIKRQQEGEKLHQKLLDRLPAVPVLNDGRPRPELHIRGHVERERRCLYLASDQGRAPIVWADDVHMVLEDKGAWHVVDVTTIQAIREGDAIVGYGGMAGEGFDPGSVAAPGLPRDCKGAPVLIGRVFIDAPDVTEGLVRFSKPAQETR